MAKANCSLSDCGKPAMARGWCAGHYQRWRAYGDPSGTHPSRRTVLDRLHDDGTRTCGICAARKSLHEFPSDSSGPGGKRLNCKVCHSAKSTAWYQANKDEHLPRAKARYARDIEKIRARDKARYERDKPKRLALVVDAGNRRRATLRHGGPWDRGITCRALRKRDGDECCYCGERMTFAPATGHVFIADKATIEHVVPISSGGTHTWDNVALACWQCNVRKQARPLEEWVTDATELRRVRQLLPGAAAQLEILFGELPQEGGEGHGISANRAHRGRSGGDLDEKPRPGRPGSRRAG